MIQRMEYLCNKCEHEWISRIVTLPVQCPRCKSVEWNSPIKPKEESK